MLLFLLLAVAQGPAQRGPTLATDAIPPPRELTSYLAVAASYGSANRAAALQEVRRWSPREITSAVEDLQAQARRLRSVPTSTGDIAFGTVEAAVLMHAEAGLLSLQALSRAEAEAHLKASVTLYHWSRAAAAEARRRTEARRRAFESGQPPPGLEIRERIGRRDFYLALAAGALAIGFPPTARPFAERARDIAPLDPEVQLVYACMAESLADEELLRHRRSAAEDRRDQAEGALADALALDPGLLEARLHLGKLLLDRGRLVEAEPRLREVETHSRDDRQRYLARLFLGRLADRRGRLDEAAGSYGRALEAWPDSQAARLALGHALESTSRPAAALPLVAASLAASRRPDRAADPWWLYRFGPPGVATAALDRVWAKVLER